MTEHVQEQISAFIDDELSSEECAFLVRRFSSDPHARQQVVRYAAIGSALRSEALSASSSLLRDRINSALDGMPSAPARQSRQPARVRRWAQLMAGSSIAASVAVAALFGLRSLNQPNEAVVNATTVAAPGRQWTEPASYVVPGESADAARVVVPPIRLTNYLMQHGNYASMLHRNSVHSNVVGINESELDPAAQLQSSEAGRP
jgi:negative regulator of sigma E activity